MSVLSFLAENQVGCDQGKLHTSPVDLLLLIHDNTCIDDSLRAGAMMM